MNCRPFLPVALLLVLWTRLLAAANTVNLSLPAEPVDIGDQPQFVFDNYIVENHWARNYKTEAVTRVFHQARKHEENPLLKDSSSGHWILRDSQTGLFRMWYQLNVRIKDPTKANDPNNEAIDGKGRKFRTHVAYAESTDGLHWTTPDLDLYHPGVVEPNNIVLGDPTQPKMETCSPHILEVPEQDRRGYRFIMTYRAKGPGGKDVAGIHLIGSHDGIHWDPKSDMRIAYLGSDTYNTIIFDPRARQYVMFCRPKDTYEIGRGGETKLEDGVCRRMARLTSDTLWTDWLEHAIPQTILVPDEIDAQTHHNFFYGMPTRYYAGLYWGFLWPFRMNTIIHTELATSRDGIRFDRMPGVPRPKLIEYGVDGSWDDEMIFGTPSWVEVGDEWWVYYSGWDGPHETANRHGGLGLAKIRKEGFVSMHFPERSGALVTRLVRWAGSGLSVNVDASKGELKVRLSDEGRRVIPGFDYDDCVPFTGDSVAHPVTWKAKSIELLNGRTMHIEFQLKNGDLYTFRASPPNRP